MEQTTLSFVQFAEYLFTPNTPPPPNALHHTMIDITFAEESNATKYDFLHDLFGYGYHKLYGSGAVSEDEGLKRYEHLRGYFQALGFDLLLLNYKKGEDNLITDIQIAFQPLPPPEDKPEAVLSL